MASALPNLGYIQDGGDPKTEDPKNLTLSWSPKGMVVNVVCWVTCVYIEKGIFFLASGIRTGHLLLLSLAVRVNHWTRRGGMLGRGRLEVVMSNQWDRCP